MLVEISNERSPLMINLFFTVLPLFATFTVALSDRLRCNLRTRRIACR